MKKPIRQTMGFLFGSKTNSSNTCFVKLGSTGCCEIWKLLFPLSRDEQTQIKVQEKPDRNIFVVQTFFMDLRCDEL